jgi:hypothetical protein
MKMKIAGGPHVGTAKTEGFEVASSPKNTIQKHQLIQRLKWLANENYQLMVKIKILANTLKKPAFKEIIESADYFSDRLMTSLNHYVFHIKSLENSNADIPSVVQACEVPAYTGWVDRVKEMIHIQLKIKEQIIEILFVYQETDFSDLFHFLREQLTLHEDEIWHLRNQIEG